MPGRFPRFEIDVDEKVARVWIGRAIPQRRDRFILDDEIANVRQHPGDLSPAGRLRIRCARNGREQGQNKQNKKCPHNDRNVAGRMAFVKCCVKPNRRYAGRLSDRACRAGRVPF